MNHRVYTDGSCINNGKPDAKGGWAYVIMGDDDKIAKMNSGQVVTPEVTNNRMEMEAVLMALRDLHKNFSIDDSFTIVSDSKYVITCYTDYLENWVKNRWQKKTPGEIKNVDLWMKINKAKRLVKFDFEWVKGHSGENGNELVDELAYEMAAME